MNINKSRVWLLIFLCSCHVVGILFFCKGFLLKRVVIPEYSKCSLPTLLGVTDNPDSLPSCTGHTRKYKRVLWLLIDALRYDFMLYNDSLHPVPVYRNKMTFVRDLLQNNPSNAKLFKFIADPPTTTMQRLKALTTGGLPTFIDIGSNFNSYEIHEDSLIYQASKNGRNVTFMGDDTWLGLYPNMLSKVFDYPSLNVKDIHTVDNGVIEHLFPELETRDADIIVGHFLGVDHVGHTYGPSHWTMGKKLTQMDDILKSVVEAVDEDTMVLVFGDHGMTSTGDHGGETELETNAALLVYSKRPLFNPQQPPGRPVYQIDLVPTVALLLGVPIPFSNLGMLIPELFLPPPTDETTPYTDGYSDRVTDDLLTVLKINALQIHKYLVTYAQYSGDFPQHSFNALTNQINHATSLHDTISPQDGQTKLTEVATAYISYMRDVKKMCHSVWAKFDDVPIWYGLALTALSVLTAPFIIVDTESFRLHRVIYRSAFVSAALTSIATLNQLEFSMETVSWVAASFVYWTLTVSLLALMWNNGPSLLRSVTSYAQHPLPLLASVLVILNAVSLLSNSFVLYEGDMLVFFIQTLILCFAVRHLRVVVSECTKGLLKPVLRIMLVYVGLMTCVRLTKMFYSCRDLQFQDGCQDMTFVQALQTARESLGWLVNVRLLFSCVCVIATPIIASRVIGGNNSSKHINKYLLSVSAYGLPIAGLCVSGYWCLQLLPQATLTGLSYWEHVILPWIVYAITVSIIVIAVCRPLTVFDKHLTMADGSEESSIHKTDHSYSAVKLPKGPIVVTLGIVIVTSVWVPLTMLLNDGLALSAFLVALQTGLCLKALTGSRIGSPLTVAVFWTLMTSHTFFAFGHSTTVTSLRFECAFTGIHGEINSYNLPLAGALVGLNTLGSQILFGLGIPLLLLTDTSQGLLTGRILKTALMLMFLHSVKLLVSMFAASLHRRHLMVWWVFTPRFLYESAFQVTSDIAFTLAYLFVARLENTLTQNRSY